MLFGTLNRLVHGPRQPKRIGPPNTSQQSSLIVKLGKGFRPAGDGMNHEGESHGAAALGEN